LNGERIRWDEVGEEWIYLSRMKTWSLANTLPHSNSECTRVRIMEVPIIQNITCVICKQTFHVLIPRYGKYDCTSSVLELLPGRLLSWIYPISLQPLLLHLRLILQRIATVAMLSHSRH
jgi:hypothetical protein